MVFFKRWKELEKFKLSNSIKEVEDFYEKIVKLKNNLIN